MYKYLISIFSCHSVSHTYLLITSFAINYFYILIFFFFFFFQAEDGIRDIGVTGVQTCALPISRASASSGSAAEPAAAEQGGGVAAGAVTRTRAGLPVLVGGIALLLCMAAIAEIGRASCRERV